MTILKRIILSVVFVASLFNFSSSKSTLGYKDGMFLVLSFVSTFSLLHQKVDYEKLKLGAALFLFVNRAKFFWKLAKKQNTKKDDPRNLKDASKSQISDKGDCAGLKEVSV